MTAGLQVFNDSNSLVIDSSYFNYTLLTKLSLTSAKNQSLNMQIIEFNVPSSKALVAVYSPSSVIALWDTRSSDNGQSLLYRYVLPQSDAPVTAEFYVFSGDTMAPGNSAGMEVFDSSGRCVFSGAYRYARVVGFVGTPTEMESTTIIPAPSAAKVALVMTGHVATMITTTSLNSRTCPTSAPHLQHVAARGVGVRSVPGGVEGSSWAAVVSPPICSVSSYSGTQSSRSCQYILLDVSGY